MDSIEEIEKCLAVLGWTRTRLAQVSGIDLSIVSRHLNRENANPETIKRLRDAVGLSENVDVDKLKKLVNINTQGVGEHRDYKTVRVRKFYSIPTPGDKLMSTEMVAVVDYLSNANAYILSVQDDAMNPRYLYGDELVMWRLDQPVNPQSMDGKVCGVSLNGERMVRRIKIDINTGDVILEAENASKYPPIRVKAEDEFIVLDEIKKMMRNP